jgi:Collagen triple helix repeat (20 copies)
MLKRRLKEPFGKAGLIVAVVALVFAMLGGAYAATGGNSSKATASAKQGKQGKQGKTGKTGPAGPAGTAGPAGPAGAKGDTGAAGSNGKDGTNGTNGKNGTNGEDGETGFTETLPSGKTETGSWGGITNAAGVLRASLPFAIPISSPLTSAQSKVVKYPGFAGAGTGDLVEGSEFIENVTGIEEKKFVNSLISGTGIPTGAFIRKFISSTKLELSEPVEAGKTATGVALTTTVVPPPAECESAHAGTASAENPEAAPGFLCIYVGTEGEGGSAINAFKPGAFTGGGTSTAGGNVTVNIGGANQQYWGTFAVTG